MKHESPRTKARPNGMDVLLWLLLAALLFSLVWFGILGRSFSAPPKETAVSYRLQFSNLDPAVATALTVGQKLYDIAGDAALGTITHVLSEPYLYEGTLQIDPATQEGIKPLYPHPERVTVTVTVSANVTGLGQIPRVNGVALSAGGKLSVHTPTFRGLGYCLDLVVV